MMKTSLPPAGANFVKLLIENQRLAVLPDVATQFRRLKNRAEGFADCLIETAFPLSEAQVANCSLRSPGSSARNSSPRCG